MTATGIFFSSIKNTAAGPFLSREIEYLSQFILGSVVISRVFRRMHELA